MWTCRPLPLAPPSGDPDQQEVGMKNGKWLDGCFLHHKNAVVVVSCPAVKNQVTGHLFLNDEDEFPESRVVIEKGVAWEYTNNDDRESVQTTGPLKYGVLVMVSQRQEAGCRLVCGMVATSGGVRSLFTVQSISLRNILKSP